MPTCLIASSKYCVLDPFLACPLCSVFDDYRLLQQAQPAGGEHHIGLLACSPQPDHVQQQVKQSQAAKRDTEQLYSAFLCAARDEIAAETEYGTYSASAMLLKLAWACQTDMHNLPCLQPLLQPYGWCWCNALAHVHTLVLSAVSV